MTSSRIGAFVFGLSLLFALTAPAAAQAAPEDEIRTVIARWYQELAEEDEGRLDDIVASGMIDASPYYDYIDTGSAAAGPVVYTSLAARALQFTHRIRSIRADSGFAKVRVDERGYFYAWAARVTYESHADTTFILELDEEDARWRIIAHQTASHGFAPSQATVPMPDLRELFYATEGKDRDPARDAAEARNF
jgi:hypothetical protein